MARQSALVVVRTSPTGSAIAAEGLRIAVGFTLGLPDVAAMLVDDAVVIALASETAGLPNDVLRPWETLADLGLTRYVERESLAERDFAEVAVQPGVVVVPRDEGAAIMAAADVVAVF